MTKKNIFDILLEFVQDLAEFQLRFTELFRHSSEFLILYFKFYKLESKVSHSEFWSKVEHICKKVRICSRLPRNSLIKRYVRVTFCKANLFIISCKYFYVYLFSCKEKLVC